MTAVLDDALYEERFYAAASRHWHPVSRIADVGAGEVLAVSLLGLDLALWRRDDGSLGLVEDACSHRGTRLSLGSVAPSGCLTCPYHAWEFGADGACARIPQLPGLPIPAKTAVRSFAVVEHAGLVWACLDPESAPSQPPQVPEDADDRWVLQVGEPMTWECQSTRQIENFLDIAHFSVVHTDAFGNPDVMEVPDHAVDVDGAVIRTSFVYPAIDMMAMVDPGTPRPVSPITFNYTVKAPFWVRIDSESNGHPHVLVLANQPLSAHRCRVYWLAVMPADAAVPAELVEAGEQLIFNADQRVVETQRPRHVPLEVGAETHLPFDRLAIAYRRTLSALGFPASGNGS